MSLILPTSVDKPDQLTEQGLRRFARALYEDRQRRDGLFGGRIFGEPAWDMLLALYGRDSSDEAPNVTWLAGASHVPQTTAVRWQWVLIEEGLIEFGPSSLVPSTRAVALTRRGRNLMKQCLLQSVALNDAMACTQIPTTETSHKDTKRTDNI